MLGRHDAVLPRGRSRSSCCSPPRAATNREIAARVDMSADRVAGWRNGSPMRASTVLRSSAVRSPASFPPAAGRRSQGDHVPAVGRAERSAVALSRAELHRLVIQRDVCDPRRRRSRAGSARTRFDRGGIARGSSRATRGFLRRRDRSWICTSAAMLASCCTPATTSSAPTRRPRSKRAAATHRRQRPAPRCPQRVEHDYDRGGALCYLGRGMCTVAGRLAAVSSAPGSHRSVTSSSRS